MTTFAALIYAPQGQNGHRDPAILDEYQRFIDEATQAGVLLGGHPLEGIDTARCIRVSGGARGGPVTVTDGPFAETKEILAGFFLLDCIDLEEATKNGQPRCPTPGSEQWNCAPSRTELRVDDQPRGIAARDVAGRGCTGARGLGPSRR